MAFNYDDLIAPGQGYDDAYFRNLWDSTPGGIDNKLHAIAAVGLGWAGALEWAKDAGVASPQAIDSSGTAIAVGQAAADSDKGLGSFLQKAIPSALVGTSAGLTGQALATGNDPKQAALMDVGALAAAPAVSAALPAVGLSTLTPAAVAAPAAAGTTAAGTAALSTEPYLGATAVGATEAAPSALEPYFGATSVAAPETAAVGAAPVLGGAEGGTLAGGSAGATSGGMSGAATGLATGAGVGAGTALSRILGNDPSNPATNADWLSILGTGAATGLGIYGSNQQADALRAIAEQSRADRAPFLAKANEYLANPNAYLEGPGKASMDAVLRRLSVNGNPAGIPTSMQLAGDYGLKSWLDATTGFANVGLSGEDTRANLGAKATGADANALNAVGYGIGQLTNPQPSLEQLIKQMRGAGASLV